MINFLHKFCLRLRRSALPSDPLSVIVVWAASLTALSLGFILLTKFPPSFSFSVPRLVVFGKHIKSVGRDVWASISRGTSERQARRGEDARPFSDASDQGLRNADPGRQCRPTGGERAGEVGVEMGGWGGQMKELGAGFKERLMSLCAPSSISSSAAPTAEVCVTYSRSTLH